MAKIRVQVDSTSENCKQLALLLQVSEEEIQTIRNGGMLDLHFNNIMDSEAMFIITKAVSNHGFLPEITKEEEPKTPPVTKSPISKKDTSGNK